LLVNGHGLQDGVDDAASEADAIRPSGKAQHQPQNGWLR
jgi:hypothetical protein